MEHDERRPRIVIGGHTTGEFEWVDEDDDEEWEEDDRVFEEDLAPEDA